MTQNNGPHLKVVKKPKIAVVVPAHNEELSIREVLLELEQVRNEYPQWEILPVVVNDGSSDQTGKILCEISEKQEMVVLDHVTNLGLGSAIKTGLQYAAQCQADVSLQLDADGQHIPIEIPKLVIPVLEGKADVVVGSRFLTGAGGRVSGFARRAGTAWLSYFLKLVSGASIKDATSGFRAFGKTATSFLASHGPSDYPEVPAYVLLKRHGFHLAEVAVEMRPRKFGKSYLNFLTGSFYIFKVILSSLSELTRAKRPQSERMEPQKILSPGLEQRSSDQKRKIS